MRFSPRRNFIFFANPKTGSTSLEKLLHPYSRRWPVYKHMRPLDARVFFARKRVLAFYEGAFKFTFTRNPWDRTVSLYEYSRKVHSVAKPFALWVQGIRAGVDKDGKITSACSFDSFAGDGQGNIVVNEVVKLEEIAEKLPPLLERLSIPRVAIPRENAIPRKHYREYYDEMTRAHVAQLYAADIERFGYAF
jgi:hypothetical protein